MTLNTRKPAPFPRRQASLLNAWKWLRRRVRSGKGKLIEGSNDPLSPNIALGELASTLAEDPERIVLHIGEGCVAEYLRSISDAETLPSAAEYLRMLQDHLKEGGAVCYLRGTEIGKMCQVSIAPDETGLMLRKSGNAPT